MKRFYETYGVSERLFNLQPTEKFFKHKVLNTEENYNRKLERLGLT